MRGVGSRLTGDYVSNRLRIASYVTVHLCCFAVEGELPDPSGDHGRPIRRIRVRRVPAAPRNGDSRDRGARPVTIWSWAETAGRNGDRRLP